MWDTQLEKPAKLCCCLAWKVDVGNLGLNGIARSRAPFVSGRTSSRTEADFYLTARGRLGFVAAHWLFYGTGGYFGAERFRSGRTAGGGIEWNLSGSWTAKAEYLSIAISTARRSVVWQAGSGRL